MSRVYQNLRPSFKFHKANFDARWKTHHLSPPFSKLLLKRSPEFWHVILWIHLSLTNAHSWWDRHRLGSERNDLVTKMDYFTEHADICIAIGCKVWERYIACQTTNPVKHIYFPNILFVVLHTSLHMTLIKCMCKVKHLAKQIFFTVFFFCSYALQPFE